MRVGDLVVEGLSQYIGTITAVDKNRLCSPYFVQFFNTYDGDDITDWYTDGDLEVICK